MSPWKIETPNMTRSTATEHTSNLSESQKSQATPGGLPWGLTRADDALERRLELFPRGGDRLVDDVVLRALLDGVGGEAVDCTRKHPLKTGPKTTKRRQTARAISSLPVHSRPSHSTSGSDQADWNEVRIQDLTESVSMASASSVESSSHRAYEKRVALETTPPTAEHAAQPMEAPMDAEKGTSGVS